MIVRLHCQLNSDWSAANGRGAGRHCGMAKSKSTKCNSQPLVTLYAYAQHRVWGYMGGEIPTPIYLADETLPTDMTAGCQEIPFLIQFPRFLPSFSPSFLPSCCLGNLGIGPRRRSLRSRPAACRPRPADMHAARRTMLLQRASARPNSLLLELFPLFFPPLGGKRRHLAYYSLL